MGEISELARAVEELHETDRLVDLVLEGLRREHAPPALIEQGEALRLAYQEWQES